MSTMSIVTPTDTIQCGDTEAVRDVLYDYQCTSSASIRARITTLHLLVLFGVFFFGALLMLFFLRIRRHQIYTYLRRFPRKKLRLDRQNIPKRMYKQMLNEMARVSNDTLYPLPDNLRVTGWGYDYDDDTGRLRGNHFKSTISVQYRLIEKAVEDHLPSLRRMPYETLREYMTRLKQRWPGLSSLLVEEFLNHFERATYSDTEFSEQEYKNIMYNVFLLFKALEVAIKEDPKASPATLSSLPHGTAREEQGGKFYQYFVDRVEDYEESKGAPQSPASRAGAVERRPWSPTDVINAAQATPLYHSPLDASPQREDDSSDMHVAMSPRGPEADVASSAAPHGGRGQAKEEAPVYRGVHTERGLKVVVPRHHVQRSSAPPLTPVMEEAGSLRRTEQTHSGSGSDAEGNSSLVSVHDSDLDGAAPPFPDLTTRHKGRVRSANASALRAAAADPPPAPLFSSAELLHGKSRRIPHLQRAVHATPAPAPSPSQLQLLQSASGSSSAVKAPAAPRHAHADPALSPTPPPTPPSQSPRSRPPFRSHRMLSPPTADQTRRLVHGSSSSSGSNDKEEARAARPARLRVPGTAPPRSPADPLAALSPGSSDRGTVLMHDSSEEN